MQTGLIEHESLFIDRFVINIGKVITLPPLVHWMFKHVNCIELSRVTLILFAALSVRINCDVCVKALEWGSFGIQINFWTISVLCFIELRFLICRNTLFSGFDISFLVRGLGCTALSALMVKNVGLVHALR